MKQEIEPINNRVNNFILICLCLAAAIVALYWPVYKYNFIKFDDEDYIINNRNIRSGLDMDTIRWAFTKSYACNWHPLTWLSHTFDYQLFKTWAGGYHVENVGFHILNTILLFYVFVRMTKSLWPSAFIAAVFALHPLHVESVAWVSERKDLLSTLFWILTMLAYVGYVEKPNVGRYLTTLLLYVLGLLSKSMLVTLPFVLLLLDYWPFERKFSRKLIVEKIPFFACSFIVSLLTYVSQQTGGSMSVFECFGFLPRIKNVVVSYAAYISKMFWPTNLAIFYPHNGEKLPAGTVIICASLLVLATVYFIYMGRKYKFFAVGWLWYLGTLIPVIGLVQVGAQAMADRYTYMTLTGLFIIIAFGAKEFVPAKHFKTLAVLAAATLVILSQITFRQVRYWKNSQELFGHTIAVTKDNYRMLDNYGSILMEQGAVNGAIECFKKAVNICPEFPGSHNNLGCALEGVGQLEEAEKCFKYIVEHYPKFIHVYFNLGENLRKQKKYEEAIKYFKKGLELSPNDAGLYIKIGITMINMQNFEQAVDALNKAIEFEPDNIIAHGHRSIAFAQIGKTDEAIADVRFVLTKAPDDVMMYRNLGIFLERKGDLAGAIEAYRAGLIVEPDNQNLQQLLDEDLKSQEATNPK